MIKFEIVLGSTLSTFALISLSDLNTDIMGNVTGRGIRFCAYHLTLRDTDERIKNCFHQ